MMKERTRKQNLQLQCWWRASVYCEWEQFKSVLWKNCNFTSLGFYLARILLSGAETVIVIFVQVLRTGLFQKYIFFSKSNTLFMKDITTSLKLGEKKLTKT